MLAVKLASSFGIPAMAFVQVPPALPTHAGSPGFVWRQVKTAAPHASPALARPASSLVAAFWIAASHLRMALRF
jgi:hypothetical protein